jgi:hypothetical protein
MTPEEVARFDAIKAAFPLRSGVSIRAQIVWERPEYKAKRIGEVRRPRSATGERRLHPPDSRPKEDCTT